MTRKMLPFAALVSLSVLFAQANLSTQTSPASGEKPAAFLQILNGSSPNPVSLFFEGNLVYPGIKPGARISSFAVEKGELKLLVQKDGSEARKEFILRFPKPGYYTLCLTGDFSELPEMTALGGKNSRDYRLKAELMENLKPGGNTVSVRAVNGTSATSIELIRAKISQCVVPPNACGVALNQPAELHLQALAGKAALDLFMAQEPPASNITIVFYDDSGVVGFKAMTESWGEM